MLILNLLAIVLQLTESMQNALVLPH